MLSRTKLLTDAMLVAAVKALAAQSPALKTLTKALLPDVTDVREISVHIAKAVINKRLKRAWRRRRTSQVRMLI